MSRWWPGLAVLVGVAWAAEPAAAQLDPPLMPSRPVPTSNADADDLPPRPARLRFSPPKATRPAPLTERDLIPDERTRPTSVRQAASESELHDYLAAPPPVRPARAARPRDADGPPPPPPWRDRGRDDWRDDDDDSERWFSGGRIARLFADRGGRGLFCSDHDFDQFISPVSNPFLFEDPRSLTEIRAMGLYQQVPGQQPNFAGGNIWFAGGQVRLALTERFSVTVHKLGAVGVNPGSASPFPNRTGLAELWLGPKYTFVRDVEFGTLAAAGVQFQVPIGSGGVFQDTGSLSVVPYATFGQNFFRTRLGSLNALATAGYAFSVNNQRSDYFYASGHLSYDIMNNQRFFPLVELNWVQVTTDGRSRFLAGEGRDLINFGSLGRGSQLLTGAVGARWRFAENWTLGGAYELPLVGNRDFFRHRFLLDLSWRF